MSRHVKSERSRQHDSSESRHYNSRSSRRRSRSSERSRERERSLHSRSRSPTRRHRSSHHSHRYNKQSDEQKHIKHENARPIHMIKHDDMKPLILSSHQASSSSLHSTYEHSDDRSYDQHDTSTKVESSSNSSNQPIVKELPNYHLSGLLIQDALQRSNDSVIKSDKYCEPADAAIPSMKYRLYCFEGDHQHDEPIRLSAGISCYMIGRDDQLCYISISHPSVSQQHAVIQFRRIWQAAAFTSHVADTVPRSTSVPYLMDLASTNGTCLNGRVIESQRYIELRHKDVLTFGQTPYEYVLLQEQ